MELSNSPSGGLQFEYSDLFLNKIKQEANVVSSISSILEKMQEAGCLGTLHKSLQSILQTELSLSYQEFSKFNFSNQNFDFSTLYANNIFIFKENLKIISNFVSKLISRRVMEGAFKS